MFLVLYVLSTCNVANKLWSLYMSVCSHCSAKLNFSYWTPSLLKLLILILMISGLIYDHTKSYTIPFLLAGIPPIVGALILFLVYCVPEDHACKTHPSLCLVEAPLHDSTITPLQNDAGNGDEGIKLSTPANGVCIKSASPPPSYKEVMAGMWVQILSSSATTPCHIPECRHLLAQERHSYSLNRCFNSKERCYKYSVL
jgi:hypothetical protein